MRSRSAADGEPRRSRAKSVDRGELSKRVAARGSDARDSQYSTTLDLSAELVEWLGAEGEAGGREEHYIGLLGRSGGVASGERNGTGEEDDVGMNAA
jgi:hypothetical protein